jgi:hypothetical protein
MIFQYYMDRIFIQLTRDHGGTMTDQERTAKRFTLLSRLAAPLFRYRAQKRVERHRRQALKTLGFDPYRVLTVPLSRIQYSYTGDKIDKTVQMGRIVSGDWDREIAEFESLDVWIAFHEHFAAGKPWSETAFYRRMLKLIESGVSRWDCHTRADLDNRYRQVDKLYKVIEAGGYRSQVQLPVTERVYLESVDEITVSISRDGEFLFEDGRHRFSIAKILSLPALPVQVVWRHRDWFAFRESIRRYIENNGPLDTPLPHPDLADLSRVDAAVMAPVINDLKSIRGPVLDLGAQLGGNSHLFEETGFQCTAADLSAEALRIAKKLKSIENRNFAIVTDPFSCPLPCESYESVLALDAFRRYNNSQAERDRFVALLNKTNLNILYLYAPQSREQDVAENILSTSDFFQFIVANTPLNNTHILTDSADKILYKLHR